MATRVNTTRHDASSGAVATTVTPASPESRIRIWEAIAPVAVTVVLALLPTPPGLPHFAWLYFSIFAGVIVGLILEPLPGAAIAIIGITLVGVLAPVVLFSPRQLSEAGFQRAEGCHRLGTVRIQQLNGLAYLRRLHARAWL